MTRSEYKHLEKAFDPCNKENLLVTGQLPGWEEGLIKRLCVVYDPHNILPAMFRQKTFQLHYIESLEDKVGSHVASSSRCTDTFIATASLQPMGPISSYITIVNNFRLRTLLAYEMAGFVSKVKLNRQT